MQAMVYDYDLIFGTLLALFLCAVFLERALALVFQSKYYERYLGNKGLKPAIAFIICYLVVRQYDFDVFSLVLNRGSFFWGPVITAGVIAGGSKGVISIWQKIKEAWKMK